MRASRLTAKIDNNCIADGFQIYLHSFVIASTGEWAVVQQGMNASRASPAGIIGIRQTFGDFRSMEVFLTTGIVGEPQGRMVNLVDTQARPAQDALLAIAHDRPEGTLGHIRHFDDAAHHDVPLRADVDLKRLGAVLAVA